NPPPHAGRQRVLIDRSPCHADPLSRGGRGAPLRCATRSPTNAPRLRGPGRYPVAAPWGWSTAPPQEWRAQAAGRKPLRPRPRGSPPRSVPAPSPACGGGLGGGWPAPPPRPAALHSGAHRSGEGWMLPGWVLLLVSVGYAALLFAVAWI